jgi:hypothetical protein
LAALRLTDGTLFVKNLEGTTGKIERERRRDAQKVGASLGLNVPDIPLASIEPINVETVQDVGQGQGPTVHAEMKILNWLTVTRRTGTYPVYVSKLCCAKCRIAIDLWNKEYPVRKLKIESQGSHGDHFPGWHLPSCIEPDSKLGKRIIAKINKLPSETNGDYRGRGLVRNNNPSQREKSVSPPPKNQKVAEI